MGKLHFITYANGKNRNTGLSYVDTQRKLVGSIENVTSKEVVFHANNLDSLKQKDFDLLYKLLPCGVEFIHKHAHILKQNILIHCHMGRQRSVAMLCGFLMAKHGLNPDEACKYILKKRPEAFHFGLSLNFDQALIKYYKDLQKERS